MTKQIINLGTPDKGDGDPLRVAFAKVNGNFDELYTLLSVSSLTELAQDYAAAMFTDGTHTGITVEYDDAGNVINLTALGQTSAGATPPEDPAEGALWYDTTGGRIYVYYDSNWIDASPENFYTLPTASGSTLGGIKVGANLSIDVNGVLSAGNSYVLPTATTSVLGGVKVDGTTVTINNGVISALDPNLLGDLEITGQTIRGTISNQDITLEPSGVGGVSVPKLNIPVGTILGGTAPIIYTLTDVVLDSILEYSTSPTDALVPGDYGIANGIPAPYAVYQFTADPIPALEVNDILAGVGIPNAPDASVILAVGTGIYSDVVIAYSDYSAIPVPGPGTVITVARATTNATMFLDTEALTDIALSPGPGGNIVARSNILPYTTDVYDLGSPAKRFRRVWLGAGTLYVQDETLGTDQAIGARDGNLYISGGAGLEVGQFIFENNQIKIKDPSTEILIGAVGATAPVTFRRNIQIRNATDSFNLFKADAQGVIQIRSDISADPTKAAVEVIASQSGLAQSPNNTGVLLHLTGLINNPSRVYNDSFGTSAYSAYIGRRARGTAAAPSQTLANDIISRIGANPYKETAFSDISTMRMDFVVTENQTNSAQGNEIQIWTTAIGETIIRKRIAVDSTGIVLTAAGGGGITFPDTTRQTTAWTGTIDAGDVTGLSLVATTNNYSDLTGLPTLFSGDYDDLTNKPNVVTSVAVTSGLTVGRVNGAVTIGNSGVLSVAAAAGTGQLGVSTVGGAVTLTMPQGLGTTNSVTFNNLTITGTLTVENFEVATEPTIEGKILYLASTAANDIDIDGGGIVLGPTDSTVNFRSFLYDLASDRWNTNGAGLQTLDLFSDTIEVQGKAYFGNAYNDYDFPNAVIQIDGNVNSYIQVVSKNHSDGIIASSDFVATNDIGDDTSHYIDMGIVSSNYTDGAWPILAPNDGYVYVNSGNLRIGTDTATKDIKFFTGGTLEENIRAIISDTGIDVIGDVSATSFTGDVTGNVSGNAGTVTNGVYTNGSYANPSWISSLAWSKITDVPFINGYTGSQGFTGSQGNVGFTGSQGVGFAGSRGFTGSQGTVGFSGSQGIQGNIGFTGSQGAGFTGSQGNTGNTGNTGFTGSQGNTGFTGSQGNTGNTGNTGFTGSQGNIGNTGFTGSQGNIGNTGFTGSQGNQGNIGFTGSQGNQGNIGFTGSQGNQGNIGFTGSVGFTGSQGAGFTGSQGNTGNTGFTGSQGIIGFTGSAGTSGVTSIAGGTNIVLSGSTGAVTIQRVDGSQTVVTGNSSATYNVLTTDQYIGTTRSATGTGTITLPLGSTVSVGRHYIIKDEGGQSGSFLRRITVAASGSDTIDGSATRSITSNYGSLTVLWTGTRWSVI